MGSVGIGRVICVVSLPRVVLCDGYASRRINELALMVNGLAIQSRKANRFAPTARATVKYAELCELRWL